MTPIHPSSPLVAHELAAIFPMCQPDVLEAIKQDMLLHGFDASQPIVLLDGKVLDGRNRLWAALEAGVEPVQREYLPKHEGPPHEFVYRRNFPRRDLTVAQRLSIAKEFGKIVQDRKPGERNAEWLARQSGASARTAHDFTTIESKAPDLMEKVQDGEISIKEAAKQARQREADQKQQAEWAEQAEIRSGIAEEIREKGARELADAILHGRIQPGSDELALMAQLPPTELQRLSGLLVAGKTVRDAQRYLDDPLRASQAIADLLGRGKILAKDYSDRILAHGSKHLIHEETLDGVTVYVVIPKNKK
jgi:post-segregation antitoxin (ccd killing protein)